MQHTEDNSYAKLATGIRGLDAITLGGLPSRRITLVAGSSGSAKTVLACQFLAGGILDRDQPGVFVTFEETPEDICANMVSFGWDIKLMETQGKWAFVDGSMQAEGEALIAGGYDLGALLARIQNAVHKTQAKRVAIDSLGALFSQFTDRALVRHELFRIASALRKMGVTTIMTAEREEEYGPVSRYGVEEFVADNVIILRNALEGEKRRRTIEVLKFRGANHQKGEFPFAIQARNGIVVIPFSEMPSTAQTTLLRTTFGNADIDRMCNGGLYQDSIVLVSGATGTGKTLMTTEFLSGTQADERCVLFAFEENRDQLIRNANGWGVDFVAMEQDGRLRIVCEYPEAAGLENLLILMRETIEEYHPHRIAIDGLTALEHVSSIKGFRQFVIALTSYIKEHGITAMFTATTPGLMGGESVTESHISTITDTIVLLRYVETFGEMRRGITILKTRGSGHDKHIREFWIDGEGMHVSEPFVDVTGIIAGHPRYLITRDKLDNDDTEIVR